MMKFEGRLRWLALAFAIWPSARRGRSLQEALAGLLSDGAGTMILKPATVDYDYRAGGGDGE